MCPNIYLHSVNWKAVQRNFIVQALDHSIYLTSTFGTMKEWHGLLTFCRCRRFTRTWFKWPVLFSSLRTVTVAFPKRTCVAQLSTEQIEKYAKRLPFHSHRRECAFCSIYPGNLRKNWPRCEKTFNLCNTSLSLFDCQCICKSARCA